MISSSSSIKFCAWIALLVITVIKSEAQDVMTELTVDRPGFAETPYTVGPGHYQFEVGFDYFKRYSGERYQLPAFLFRTGVSNNAELRISFRQLVDREVTRSFNGISPLNIGVKVHIIKQTRWIPETDILTNLVIPLGSSYVQPKNLGHEVLLLFEKDFYPKSAINYNIGHLWDSYQQQGIFTFSFCYNYLPSPALGLFLEYFSFVPKQWPGEQGLDGGVTYLIAPKVQLDFSVGYSLLENQNNYFVSSGFSFRLDGKNRPTHLARKYIFNNARLARR